MRPVAHPAPLGWSAECRETLRLAGPLALANLLQMLTYAVDVMFIARLGAAELAASALSVAVFSMLLWSLFGLVSALAPIIAAELGARGPALRPIRRSVRMALWLAVIAGCAAMGLCTFAERFMLATGQDPAISALAGEYMDVLLFATVPMLAAGVLRNFVAALGRPVLATAITALGVVANVAGNYVLIFGHFGAPAMGLAGAAGATVLTGMVVLAAYVAAILLDPRLARYRVFGFIWRPDWKRMGELLRIGTPIALTTMAEAGVFGAAAFLMGLLGPAQLAAHTLALQVVALTFQVPFGIGQATSIRTGYFFGAREPLGITRAGWTGIAMGGAFMALSAGALLAAPQYWLAIYIDPWDQANREVTAFAVSYLLLGAAFQLVDGLQVVAAGALRGLKDTRVPMWIAMFSFWVPGFGTAAVLAFVMDMGGQGIWLGLTAGLACAAVLLVWRWHALERRGSGGAAHPLQVEQGFA